MIPVVFHLLLLSAVECSRKTRLVVSKPCSSSLYVCIYLHLKSSHSSVIGDCLWRQRSPEDRLWLPQLRPRTQPETPSVGTTGSPALGCRRPLVQFLAGMDSSQIRILLHLLFTLTDFFCILYCPQQALQFFYIFLPECTYSLAVFISVPVEMPFSIQNSNFQWLLILQNNYLLG